MSRLLSLTAALSLAVLPHAVVAQHAGMQGHDAMVPGSRMSSPTDRRTLLHFPPPMQAHFLGNMRDHMETLDLILQAVESGNFAEASQLAATRLGLDSPAAAGCKPTEAGAPPPPQDSMDAMMQLFMPEQMRAIGLSMHTAASEFATVAAKAADTHDTAAVLGALARITPNCVACHAAYRIR